MRVPFSIAALVLAAALAGCSGKESAHPQLDFITPGAWHVTANIDSILVWVHNGKSEQVKIDWSLTFADGKPLPAGWKATFTPASNTLSADGQKSSVGGRTTYPDWGISIATLEIPSSELEGTHAIELHAGGKTTDATLTIDADRGTVSKASSRVEVKYAGSFESGKEFDAGSYNVTIGSSSFVPGFKFGLIGLKLNETAELVIPPAFAYGYDNVPNPDPQLDRAKFNGEWLHFEVTLTKIQ